MDYRDNRQRWAESHQVVHFYAGQWCTFTPALTVCRHNAADLIVLGLHEIGGIVALRKAAAVAEAAGINLCVHGVFETGITTCASYHAAITLPNLDDGNQIMCQLLTRDIVDSPSLQPTEGRLTLPGGAGFGFALDQRVIDDAEKRYTER